MISQKFKILNCEEIKKIGALKNTLCIWKCKELIIHMKILEEPYAYYRVESERKKQNKYKESAWQWVLVIQFRSIQLTAGIWKLCGMCPTFQLCVAVLK